VWRPHLKVPVTVVVAMKVTEPCVAYAATMRWISAQDRTLRSDRWKLTTAVRPTRIGDGEDEGLIPLLLGLKVSRHGVADGDERAAQVPQDGVRPGPRQLERESVPVERLGGDAQAEVLDDVVARLSHHTHHTNTLQAEPQTSARARQLSPESSRPPSH
jgi:hypothetical protein